jgi:hypothetical protein
VEKTRKEEAKKKKARWSMWYGVSGDGVGKYGVGEDELF